MGIGYVDSVIIYNRYISGLWQKVYYFGTRFDNVRVELTQGANIQASGIQDADICKVKIPNMDLPKPYISPEMWQQLTTDEMEKSFTLDSANDNFCVVVKKDDLGINVSLPEGLVDGDTYTGGFFEYVKNTYGYAYSIRSVDVYRLVPRFEVSGR